MDCRFGWANQAHLRKRSVERTLSPGPRTVATTRIGCRGYVDRQSGLNLKHTSPAGNPINFATIGKDGFVDTGPATWRDRTEIGRRYNEALAAAIKGFVREMKAGRESAVRTASGKTPRLTDFLPAHEDAWLKAIERYTIELFEAAKAET